MLQSNHISGLDFATPTELGTYDDHPRRKESSYPFLMGLPGVPKPLFQQVLHSPKLTWKWRGAPYKTTILYIGPSMSFHVNLGEGKRAISAFFRAWALSVLALKGKRYHGGKGTSVKHHLAPIQ